MQRNKRPKDRTMARPAIPQAQKDEEGRRLKQMYEKLKQERGITQDKLCAAIDLNPGLLHSYFTGKKPIPLDTLLDLAKEMDFDPREIRPNLDEFAGKLLSAMRMAGSDGLIDQLSPAYKRQAIDYIQYLKSRDAQ